MVSFSMFVTTILGLLTLLSTSFVNAIVVVNGTQAGVDPSSGFRPLRIEINQFQHAGPAWDLYILSLQQLQAQNQSAQLSYYQVAGIHGYPNVPWDGVTGTGGGTGYCMHGSILFPMWHRPYLALFEVRRLTYHCQICSCV